MLKEHAIEGYCWVGRCIIQRRLQIAIMDACNNKMLLRYPTILVFPNVI